jgi:DNA-binding response OmpR family regulator
MRKAKKRSMSLSVLVIEGDPAVAEFFLRVLAQQGWDVCVPRNEDGLVYSLFGDRHFDLITVSYRFPNTNGVAIVRLIREFEGRKMTPVLLVTGSPDVTQEALAAGANEVLYKPIGPHRLVGAVTWHTASRAAR